MKWTSLTLDFSKIRKIAQTVGAFGKTFAVLSAVTLLFFILLGLAAYGQGKSDTTAASSLKGLAASVSNGFFLDVMGLEVPNLPQAGEKSAFSQSNLFGFAFRLITGINPKDPKTLLAREMPGLNADSPWLLRKGAGTDGVSGGPQDYSPPQNGSGGTKMPAPQQSPAAVPSASPNPGPSDSPAATSPSPTPSPSPSAAPANRSTDGRKVVLIYHSHNRESFMPELGVKDPDSAFDPKINVTLVGQRLANKLEELGVGAVDYNTDYTSTEKNFSFAYSYKYSQKTVKEAFAANPDLQFVFDIHRDSIARDKTTVTIGGKDYAQVYFIIGESNPNWKKNEQFASKIQEQLDQKMPGISRGIWGKNAHNGNGEYNQSLSPNSVLLEIGGPYNSLEECYRTADVLAGIIADLYWKAEKVSAPAAAAGK